MRDLEQQIQAWRSEMLADGIRAPVPLDELESHLRDDIAQQIQGGLDSQAAFETAAKKFGEANMLNKEFKKNRPAALGEKLMLSLALLCVAFIIFLGGFAVFYCYSDWDDRVMAAVPMACTLLLAWGWARLAPRLPVIANTRKRAALGIGCIAFGFAASGLFCSYVLPCFETSADRMIPPAGFWMAFIIAGFACLGLALAMDYEARARLGTAISQRLADRAKNAMLSVAGIPNHYLLMNEPSFKLDSRGATYLRSAFFLLPATILWMLAAVYVIPQFNSIWNGVVGHGDASSFDRVLRFDFNIMNLFKDNFLYIVTFTSIALVLLEWRSRGWPRYRRAVIGAVVFLCNLTIVLSFAIMFLGATLAATWLAPHAKM